MKAILLSFRIIRTMYWINQFNIPGFGYHRMARRKVDEVTAPFALEHVPNFPANGKLKMQWYMADTIFACEQFARLLGHRSSAKQRDMYLQGGALLTMSDLVIDDIDMDMARVKLFRNPPADLACKDDVERLFVSCYHHFFTMLDERTKAHARKYFELLFDAQVDSKRQFDPHVSREEVDDICKRKCGYSTLFMRAMVTDEMHAAEEIFWFELGAFVQFSNDAQDLHKDLKKGIRTFASTRPDLQTIIDDLETQSARAIDLLWQMPFEEKRKDDFQLLFFVMHQAILAKLSFFSEMCDQQFSQQKFIAIDTREVRARTAPLKLLRAVVPRAFRYRRYTPAHHVV